MSSYVRWQTAFGTGIKIKRKMGEIVLPQKRERERERERLQNTAHHRINYLIFVII